MSVTCVKGQCCRDGIPHIAILSNPYRYFPRGVAGGGVGRLFVASGLTSGKSWSPIWVDKGKVRVW